MANAYKNKVVYNGRTLIDISDTTAIASDVNSGKYLYLANGSKVAGSQIIHNITESLTKISGSNAASKILGNSTFYDELTPDEGYLISSVTITMGGVDVTDQVFTGDDGTTQSYNLTTNMSHCFITNEVITESSFYAELNTETGFDNPQVTILIGGNDMSNLYSGGVINIPHVTGDIVITAVATAAAVSSISATFNQGSNVIYDTDSLDDLKQYLTVTATYEGGTTGIVTAYTLSGTLTAGASTITVSYGGKTATFNVTVTHKDLTIQYELSETTVFDGTNRIDTGINPLSEDRDFSIYYSIILSNVSQNGNARIWHMANPEFCVLLSSNVVRFSVSGATYEGGNNNMFYYTAADITKPIKMVITHTKGSNEYVAHASYYNTSGTLQTVSKTATVESFTGTGAVTIGAYTGGAYNQGIKATYSDFVIKFSSMTSEEINNYLNS